VVEEDLRFPNITLDLVVQEDKSYTHEKKKMKKTKTCIIFLKEYYILFYLIMIDNKDTNYFDRKTSESRLLRTGVRQRYNGKRWVKLCQGRNEDGSLCEKSAQGATDYCKKHGGGKRCQGRNEDGSLCEKSALSPTDYCSKHGGGKRCQGRNEDGSLCEKSAQGATDYCINHGGGKRCQGRNEDGSLCEKSALSPTDYCINHGGGKRCEYDCCIFLDNPSLAKFKNYFNREQHICWASAKNQMYDETLTIQEREAIGNYYGFGNVDLVLRQEQAVLHLINATDIGKTLRRNSFGHSFDCDPIAKIFGKNKNVEHKKPDYVALVNKYSIIVIEYDENSSHEKSRARLNQIKDMFHLNVKEEICKMKSYTTSSASSTSSLLRNIHVIRINGRDDDKDKRVCIKRERKETEGDYTYTKRYYELSEYGFTVLMEATLLLEDIYNQILIDSDDDCDEINLQIHEIN
jgi:hypothetical protein